MARALNVDSANILIVEDELILAQALRVQLERFGYQVVGQVGTAEEAVKLASALRPDLVLMDIQLSGHGNGIEAGAEIRTRFDIPIVFLTAFSDRATIEQVKQAEPFGYLAKPVKGETLRTTVEIAIHKSRIESRLRQRERWLTSTLTSIYDALIAVDDLGRVTFLNPLAAELTGWTNTEALGRPIEEILVLRDRPGDDAPPFFPVAGVIREGHVQTFPNEARCRHRLGTEVPVAGHAAPVRDPADAIIGAALVFRFSEGAANAARLGKPTGTKEIVVACASCKNMREDTRERAWVPVEKFFENRFDILFSHGICPDCFRRLYPNYAPGGEV
jgi:two-component system, cell cycle sensor histidine kinase and response regulator CckA